MRLLDRYLLRELMIPLPYCLCGFLIFWIASDLIGELDEFGAEKLGVLDVAEYYLARLPDFLVLLLPIVLLLALLYVLTTHARHQEFTAMRAAGLSIWRIAVPYFAVGFALTLVAFGLNEYLVPAGRERADRIRNRHRVEGTEGKEWKLDVKFRNERDDRLWRIRAFNVLTGELQDPYVEWRRADGSVRQLLAARGVHDGEAWVFHNGRLRDPDPDTRTPLEAFEVLRVEELTETPDLIRSEYKVSQLGSLRGARKVQLTVADILEYRRLHPQLEGRQLALLDTQLQVRLATPWTSLVVVLIAVPFGAGSGRRNAFVGVASSIFIGFGFFVVQQLGVGLGAGGHVSPVLAAWLPNGLFGLGGLWLTSRVR